MGRYITKESYDMLQEFQNRGTVTYRSEVLSVLLLNGCHRVYKHSTTTIFKYVNKAGPLSRILPP
jgi:hypothetical protein